MEFIKYFLTSDMLCLGERIKKGTFRPTIRTIPYTQITGALKAVFGDRDIHAVGHLVEDKKYNKVDYLTYSPRDRGIETSKLPLTVEFLTNVLGHIYILKNGDTKDLEEEFEIVMGALKSKGFGRCKLKKVQEFEITFCGKYNKEECVKILNMCKERIDENLICVEIMNKANGLLNTRIPEKYLEKFGIKRWEDRPIYGYLFEPTSKTSGIYVRSIFEGSMIAGPEFLLEKGG
ncbi:MAG: hypothetical protein QMD80_04745 [archaeon]|nr:hypothetical protein [archaeon]